MPQFQVNFRNGVGQRTDSSRIAFVDLDNAYLHVCATIPDAAQELLLKGDDPLACAFEIADATGRTLMDVPFSEVLARRHWNRERAPWRPAEGVRSNRARNDLARDIFARTLGDSPIAHSLVGLDFELLNLNRAALAMTDESPERVLGKPIYECFEGYQGAMSRQLEAYFGLAVRGLKSRVSNLAYDRPSGAMSALQFWCEALAWPILDDDGRVLAVVSCAVASPRPWADGRCAVTVGHHAA